MANYAVCLSHSLKERTRCTWKRATNLRSQEKKRFFFFFLDETLEYVSREAGRQHLNGLTKTLSLKCTRKKVNNLNLS